MALLTQNHVAEVQAAPPAPQDLDQATESTEQAEDPSEPQEGLSFTAEQLVDSFKQHMEPEQIKDMLAVIDAGKELLFGPDTHSQLMGSLEGSQDIGADLGNGAFGAMNLIMKSMAQNKPGEVIDGQAVLPAGVALIAMALEFINESGMAPVNDDTFEQASHIFSTKMMSAYDPQFKERAAQYQTQQAEPPQQGAAPTQQETAQPMNGPAGGM